MRKKRKHSFGTPLTAAMEAQFAERAKAAAEFAIHPTPPPGAPRVPRTVNMQSVRVCSGSWCGVYFLLLQRNVIYVGSSVNVLRRIGDHSENLVFDDARWIPVEPEFRLVVEAEWIIKLKPASNGWTDSQGIRRLCEPKVRR